MVYTQVENPCRGSGENHKAMVNMNGEGASHGSFDHSTYLSHLPISIKHTKSYRTLYFSRTQFTMYNIYIYKLNTLHTENSEFCSWLSLHYLIMQHYKTPYDKRKTLMTYAMFKIMRLIKMNNTVDEPGKSLVATY